MQCSPNSEARSWGNDGELDRSKRWSRGTRNWSGTENPAVESGDRSHNELRFRGLRPHALYLREITPALRIYQFQVASGLRPVYVLGADYKQRCGFFQLSKIFSWIVDLLVDVGSWKRNLIVLWRMDEAGFGGRASGSFSLVRSSQIMLDSL